MPATAPPARSDAWRNSRRIRLRCVKDVACLGRRIVAPDPVDQSLDRDRPAGIHQKRCQHRLLSWSPHIQRLTRHVQRDLPEQPEVNLADVHTGRC
jgi:hypothetical protein